MFFTILAPRDLLGARRCQKRENAMIFINFIKNLWNLLWKGSKSSEISFSWKSTSQNLCSSQRFPLPFKERPVVLKSAPAKVLFGAKFHEIHLKLMEFHHFHEKTGFGAPMAQTLIKRWYFNDSGSPFPGRCTFGLENWFWDGNCSFSGNCGFGAKSCTFAEKLILGGKVDSDNLFKAEKVVH